jgi:hypothetical protein
MKKAAWLAQRIPEFARRDPHSPVRLFSKLGSTKSKPFLPVEKPPRGAWTLPVSAPICGHFALHDPALKLVGKPAA